LIDVADGKTVVGLGQPVVLALGKTIRGIEAFSDSFWRRTGFAVDFVRVMVLAARSRSRRFAASVEKDRRYRGRSIQLGRRIKKALASAGKGK